MQKQQYEKTAISCFRTLVRLMGTLTIVPQAPRMGSERHGERGWKNVIDIYIFFKENRISQ